MNESHAERLRDLAREHFNRRIDRLDYTQRRRRILDDIDRYFNGVSNTEAVMASAVDTVPHVPKLTGDETVRKPNLE